VTSLGIVLVGPRGRLGRLVLDEVQARTSAVLVGAVHRAVTPSLPDDEVCVRASLDDVLADVRPPEPGAPIVVVDVATAGSTAAHAEACAKHGVPLVCATTGLSDADRAALSAAAQRTAVLVAANLSPGAHLVALLAAQAAAAMAHADCEIVEVHHRLKKDAPSGTALMLADAVAEGRGDPKARRVCAREGEAKRQDGDIGVVAVRGGDVVGEHTVTFFAAGERVELVHKVSDRAVFAKGALDAAAFLAGRAPGLYAMTDVLKAKLGR